MSEKKNVKEIGVYGPETLVVKHTFKNWLLKKIAGALAFVELVVGAISIIPAIPKKDCNTDNCTSITCSLMSSDNYLERFISKVKELGIELNDNQINQFNKYYELLVEYNKVMNLTGITKYEEVLEKHFYDSLTMANKVDLNNSTLVDIGAGAGFPCIPLKIAFPSLDVTVVALSNSNDTVSFSSL